MFVFNRHLLRSDQTRTASCLWSRTDNFKAAPINIVICTMDQRVVCALKRAAHSGKNTYNYHLRLHCHSALHVSTPPFLFIFTISIVLQHSYRRTVGIPVHARRLVISHVTVKSSPWSKSPARAQLAISPGNTTSRRTTSGARANIQHD